MGLNKILVISGLGLLLAQLLLAGANAAGESGSVNLIIKMEQSPEKGLSRADTEMNSTINLLNEVDSRALMATIAVTGDIANELYPLYVTALGTKENHELIVSGMSSGEGAASFEDQEARLRKAKRYVEDDYVCGGKQITVAGYLPRTAPSIKAATRSWMTWGCSTWWTMPASLRAGERTLPISWKDFHFTSCL